MALVWLQPGRPALATGGLCPLSPLSTIPGELILSAEQQSHAQTAGETAGSVSPTGDMLLLRNVNFGPTKYVSRRGLRPCCQSTSTITARYMVFDDRNGEAIGECPLITVHRPIEGQLTRAELMPSGSLQPSCQGASGCGARALRISGSHVPITVRDQLPIAAWRERLGCRTVRILA